MKTTEFKLIEKTPQTIILENGQNIEIVTEVYTAEADFGIFDTKERLVGCTLYVVLNSPFGGCSNWDSVAKKGFTTWKGACTKTSIQSTRSGNEFGAVNGCAKSEAADLESAKAEALAKALKSYKRAKAKADKNHGIYKP